MLPLSTNQQIRSPLISTPTKCIIHTAELNHLLPHNTANSSMLQTLVNQISFSEAHFADCSKYTAALSMKYWLR